MSPQTLKIIKEQIEQECFRLIKERGGNVEYQFDDITFPEVLDVKKMKQGFGGATRKFCEFHVLIRHKHHIGIGILKTNDDNWSLIHVVGDLEQEQYHLFVNAQQVGSVSFYNPNIHEHEKAWLSIARQKQSEPKPVKITLPDGLSLQFITPMLTYHGFNLRFPKHSVRPRGGLLNNTEDVLKASSLEILPVEQPITPERLALLCGDVPVDFISEGREYTIQPCSYGTLNEIHLTGFRDTKIDLSKGTHDPQAWTQLREALKP